MCVCVSVCVCVCERVCLMWAVHISCVWKAPLVCDGLFNNRLSEVLFITFSLLSQKKQQHYINIMQ